MQIKCRLNFIQSKKNETSADDGIFRQIKSECDETIENSQSCVRLFKMKKKN